MLLKLLEATVYLEPGEVLTRKGICFMCSYAAFSNDACVALAESIAGSETAFVSMMNQKARDRAENTHFMNPHGLHDEAHYSSAYDMALL